MISKFESQRGILNDADYRPLRYVFDTNSFLSFRLAMAILWSFLDLLFNPTQRPKFPNFVRKFWGTIAIKKSLKDFFRHLFSNQINFHLFIVKKGLITFVQKFLYSDHSDNCWIWICWAGRETMFFLSLIYFLKIV